MHRFVKKTYIIMLTVFNVIYKMYLALEQKKCSKTKTTKQQRLLASRCSISGLLIKPNKYATTRQIILNNSSTKNIQSCFCLTINPYDTIPALL